MEWGCAAWVKLCTWLVTGAYWTDAPLVLVLARAALYLAPEYRLNVPTFYRSVVGAKADFDARSPPIPAYSAKPAS